jgi:capsular polysaccharide biosynthesis protein
VTVPNDNTPGRGWAASLPDLPFIRAALRRGAWLWCTTAIVGVLLGLSLDPALSPAYHASTSILLTHQVGEDPTEAILTDMALAQSRAVGGLVVRRLGVPESTDAFLKSYTVATVTDRVLLITVSAPSGSQAVRRARTVAAAFLQFRASQVRAAQQNVLASVDRQITQAKQHVTSATAQFTQASAQVPPMPRAKLAGLRAKLRQAENTLAALNEAQQQSPVDTATVIDGSGVLDAAALVPRSHLKLIAINAVAGLVAGLALGLGIVVIQALVSDRLRRREDVAQALGVPVTLSVGRVHVSRWWPGGRGLAPARRRGAQRIVAHLRGAVPEGSAGAAALAVVPVDNARVAALALVSLAVSCAKEGKKVVVADLCSGAPAGRLLGSRKPGIRVAVVHDARMVVAIPERDDIVPAGPVSRSGSQAQPRPGGASPADEALASAYGSADVLLTLVALDPALGADHLPTWAADAVVMVTAGRSSATRIQAVGEMIRLAGMPPASAVLVGADKTDESVGLVHESLGSVHPADPPSARPDLGVIV